MENTGGKRSKEEGEVRVKSRLESHKRSWLTKPPCFQSHSVYRRELNNYGGFLSSKKGHRTTIEGLSIDFDIIRSPESWPPRLPPRIERRVPTVPQCAPIFVPMGTRTGSCWSQGSACVPREESVLDCTSDGRTQSYLLRAGGRPKHKENGTNRKDIFQVLDIEFGDLWGICSWSLNISMIFWDLQIELALYQIMFFTDLNKRTNTAAVRKIIYSQSRTNSNLELS